MNTGAHMRRHGDLDKIIQAVQNGHVDDVRAVVLMRSFARPPSDEALAESRRYAASVALQACAGSAGEPERPGSDAAAGADKVSDCGGARRIRYGALKARRGGVGRFGAGCRGEMGGEWAYACLWDAGYGFEGREGDCCAVGLNAVEVRHSCQGDKIVVL